MSDMEMETEQFLRDERQRDKDERKGSSQSGNEHLAGRDK